MLCKLILCKIILLLVLKFVFVKRILEVRTNYGWLKGNVTKTRGGREIIEFLGVPYAKPPVKDLRFKSPVQPDKWAGIRDATKECAECIQQFAVLESSRFTVTGQEDCLCLNIFTPRLTSWCNKLPVIVFIHGGAYMGMSGRKAFFGPELLLEKEDVILVTVNYRLGVMGYMSTGDEVVPGNMGMKDQVMALKWVQENIEFFSGDPGRVTLMGQSSGAASVHLHMMSPLSQDLFDKGIMQAGSAYDRWALLDSAILRSRTMQVAQLLGCPSSPSSLLVDCLLTRPAVDIVNTTNTFVVWDVDPITIWTPTFESNDVKDAFLLSDPWKFLYNLTKPILTGFNYADGGFKTCAVTSGNVDEKFKVWNSNFNEITAISLLYDHTAPDPDSITSAVRDFYFGVDNQLITPQMTKQICDLYTDGWFSIGVLEGVLRHAGPKYLYFFNYNTSTSICTIYTGNPLYLGACHFDDLMYLFPMMGNTPKYNPQDADYQFSAKLVNIWINFVKSSDPSDEDVVWEPVHSNALEYLEITNNGFQMKIQPIKNRHKFWNSLNLKKIGGF